MRGVTCIGLYTCGLWSKKAISYRWLMVEIQFHTHAQKKEKEKAKVDYN